jgi:predicted anti-sigma-YlaC factor YlaD
VDCAEIRSSFMRGAVPDGRAVSEHLEGCPACRELFAEDAGLGRALASADADPSNHADALFAQVRAELASETGLRAHVRSQSTPRRVALACSVIVLSAAMTLAFAKRPSFPAESWLHFAATLVALGLGAVLCIREGLSSLTRPRRTARALAMSSVALGLPAVLAGLAGGELSSANPAQLVGGAITCFLFGLATSAPLVVLLWLFDRGQRVTFAVYLPLAAASGLAANLALGLHCASDEPLHLLLGHATVGIAWLLAWWTSSRFVGLPSR